jgi:hypothetical protein
MRSGIRVATGGILTGLLAGAASAGTFSFASDDNADGPVLQGVSSQTGSSLMTDGASLNLDNGVQVDFAYDIDENAASAAIKVPAIFTMSAQSISYSKSNFGGVWIHTYAFAGSYEFHRQSDGALIFSAGFKNAVWTSVSGSEFAWGQTATLQSSDDIDAAISFVAGPVINGIDLSASEDFVFTLSNLRSNTGGAVGVNAQGTPQVAWSSEASWSAQAVPAPGAVVLAAAGGLIAGRRRR